MRPCLLHPLQLIFCPGPLLSSDCAVCKDQFQLGTENPDEQIVVQLPCKHSFHQPCILPWLKSSGTCPVCRYALVPQPDHNAPRNNPTSPSTSTPFGAGGDRSNHTSSPSTAPRARSQSPRFSHRSPRPSGRPTPEPYRNSTTMRDFAPFFFRHLPGPRDHVSLASPPNTTPNTTSSEPPPIPLPASSSFEPTSESLRTQGPSRRHMHRSSIDSSVSFIPRSQLHSGYQLRNQNSGGNGSGSGSGNGSGTQEQRPHGPQPHVPGDWSDDLMDLD